MYKNNFKEHKDMVSTEMETRQIQKVALLAFLLNLLLAGLKAALAMFSGSLAITTGAVDSISDSIASLAVYGGVKLSVRKTRKFPLGLYKIENLISVFIALFIFFAGYEIAGRVIVSSSEPPEINLTVIILLLAAAVLTFLFGRYSIAVGKKTESPTLIAEGRHRETDVFSTLVILISALLQYVDISIDIWGISIDQIAAGLVLIFVAHTGWELLSSGMRVLLDASIDPETMEKVKKIIEEQPAVVDVQSLVGRNAGRFRFLEADVRLRTNDLQKAHQISDQVELDIRRQIPHVERVIIHYEPTPREFSRVAVPLVDIHGTIGSHFGGSPYFEIIQIRLSDQHVESKKIIENPYIKTEQAKGIRVAEWLINEKIDDLIIKEDITQKGPGYVLSNAGVKVHIVSMDSAEDAILSIFQNASVEAI
jgi:cation diffusion facilitator family transporter